MRVLRSEIRINDAGSIQITEQVGRQRRPPEEIVAVWHVVVSLCRCRHKRHTKRAVVAADCSEGTERIAGYRQQIARSIFLDTSRKSLFGRPKLCCAVASATTLQTMGRLPARIFHAVKHAFCVRVCKSVTCSAKPTLQKNTECFLRHRG